MGDLEKISYQEWTFKFHEPPNADVLSAGARMVDASIDC